MNQTDCKHEEIEIYEEPYLEVTYCVTCDKTLTVKKFVSNEDLAIFGELY